MKPLCRAFALAALLLVAPFAVAQEQAQPSDAEIDRLLEVMRAEQTVQAMLPQVLASQQQMVARMTQGKELSDADREKLQAMVERTNERIVDALAWEKLESLYRDIYRKTFTGAEIDSMVEFYGSPAGQAVLDKMPLLMQNTMAAMQELIVPMLQQLEQDVTAESPAN